MFLRYKRKSRILPHCGDCGEVLWGNGGVPILYKCSCGTWAPDPRYRRHQILVDFDTSPIPPGKFHILDSVWMDAGRDRIGVVAVESPAGPICRIGVARLDNRKYPEIDEQEIAALGAPLSPVQAATFFPDQSKPFVEVSAPPPEEPFPNFGLSFDETSFHDEQELGYF